MIGVANRLLEGDIVKVLVYLREKSNRSMIVEKEGLMEIKHDYVCSNKSGTIFNICYKLTA